MKKQIIDEEFYNNSDYFDNKKDIFTDLQSPFQSYRIRKVLEIYEPRPEDRVLDLGCAWGTFSFTLAKKCKEVVGVDFSKKSIEICNRIKEKKQVDNVRFKVAPAQDTQLEADYFDVIICADLVEHIYPEDFNLLLDECKRVLKPGGKLALWTPHRGHILEILKNNDILLKRDISHVDYKSMDTVLNGLKERDFNIIKQYYAESHLPVFNLIERLFLRYIPILRRRIAVLAEKK